MDIQILNRLAHDLSDAGAALLMTLPTSGAGPSLTAAGFHLKAMVDLVTTQKHANLLSKQGPNATLLRRLGQLNIIDEWLVKEVIKNNTPVSYKCEDAEPTRQAYLKALSHLFRVVVVNNEHRVGFVSMGSPNFKVTEEGLTVEINRADTKGVLTLLPKRENKNGNWLVTGYKLVMDNQANNCLVRSEATIDLQETGGYFNRGYFESDDLPKTTVLHDHLERDLVAEGKEPQSVYGNQNCQEFFDVVLFSELMLKVANLVFPSRNRSTPETSPLVKDEFEKELTRMHEEEVYSAEWPIYHFDDSEWSAVYESRPGPYSEKLLDDGLNKCRWRVIVTIHDVYWLVSGRDGKITGMTHYREWNLDKIHEDDRIVIPDIVYKTVLERIKELRPKMLQYGHELREKQLKQKAEYEERERKRQAQLEELQKPKE